MKLHTGLLFVIAAICFLGAAGIALSASGADNAKCVPTVAVEKSHRTKMKHRIVFPPTTVPLTVGELLGWAPPTGFADKNVRKRDEPIDPREANAYTVDAIVYLAKLSEDDCDIHMELGLSPTERFVVEIPNNATFTTARAEIERLLGKPLTENPIRPTKVVRVTVSGMAFWDSSHFATKDTRRGFNHGSAAVQTLWELHPVFSAKAVAPPK